MTVYLVGAGPGDPGLITVRGAELLGRAELVVHDRLVAPELIRMAPKSAEVINVGKTPGGHVAQEDINALLVREGRDREVVRLKGGDPFVFGRGGEEAGALLSAGVGFEVVPGVSAALAAPGAAGVPVTHRGLADSFTVLTASRRGGAESSVDCESLARLGGTLVVMMGVARRRELFASLVAGGLSPDTPAVGISHATLPTQRAVRSSLGRLASAEIESPATFVVGAVASLDLRPAAPSAQPSSG